MEICMAQCVSCFCGRGKGHEGPHLCACEGSWVGTYGEPGWDVISFPQRNVGPTPEERA